MATLFCFLFSVFYYKFSQKKTPQQKSLRCKHKTSICFNSACAFWGEIKATLDGSSYSHYQPMPDLPCSANYRN